MHTLFEFMKKHEIDAIRVADGQVEFKHWMLADVASTFGHPEQGGWANLKFFREDIRADWAELFKEE